MTQTIAKINGIIGDFVWGVPAMILIMGVGLLLTIRTRGLQIRRFGYSMRMTLGKVFSREQAAKGAVTPFQAVCTALAATVGTGNIAGVAGAIAIGGPGAVFWMWVSAILGMCTKYAEVTLAVHFREKNRHGDWVGGPMYFIKNGLGPRFKWLAVLFSLLGGLACFGIGNATQVSTIRSSIATALSGYGVMASGGNTWFNLAVGVVLTVLVMLVLLGGIKRLGSVTEKLVPFMALLYIVLALGVVVAHIGRVPAVLASIVEGAFSPRAVTGGVVGSMFLSMKKGVSRGIFSNEAGLGSASIAHAGAHTDSAVKQGLFGIFEVFVDTIVICTLTALVVLCSGVPVPYGTEVGAELTMSGFVATYGNWSSVAIALAICCFAFSTVLGWGLYGARCWEFLFGSRAIKPFSVVFALVCIVGTTADLGLLWNIADTLNGLMSIPNLIAVALLSPVAVKLTNEYFKKPEN